LLELDFALLELLWMAEEELFFLTEDELFALTEEELLFASLEAGTTSLELEATTEELD
jgi:hypothetical protein